MIYSVFANKNREAGMVNRSHILNWKIETKNQSETKEINQIDSNKPVTISIKTHIKKSKKYISLAKKLSFLF